MVPRGKVRVTRWLLTLGALALGLALWRLFLLFCPTRDWPVLWWSLEARTHQTWDRPQIPALVAENALENGGPIGERVGRLLYQRALVAGKNATLDGMRRPSYESLHLDRTWLGTKSISWQTTPFTKHAELVKVFVQADLPHRVEFGRSCYVVQPIMSLIERDYVVVPTGRGWRVAAVYTMYGGNATEVGAAVGKGTAAAFLAGCSGRG